MPLPALGGKSFQAARAVAGPCNDFRRVDFNWAAAPPTPKTSPQCENDFTAGGKHPSPVIELKCARLAICAAALLLWALPAWSSDSEASPAPAAASPGSTSASLATSSGSQEKAKPSGKYDVDRIGQRGIGEGVNLYSLQRERALGEAMAAAIDRRTKFVADPDVNRYANLLCQKIARNSDAEVTFTAKVIDSSELKVFALPGGFLYVDKGLIMEVDSEAELAGLMAHEIAHVAARHATRSATRKDAWNLLSFPLTYFGGPAGVGIRQVAGLGVPLSFKKFERDAEMEADLLGIEYQYAAGYDPRAFLEALEKLQSKENQARARLDKVPVFNILGKVPLHDQIARAYRDFPSTEERIRKAQAEISTLLPGKGDYVLDTSEFQEVKAKLAWADRPILRRHRPGDSLSNGPILHRRPAPAPQQ